MPPRQQPIDGQPHVAVLSAGIGLLPGFAQIGWLAPSLLIALRVEQGVAVGAAGPGDDDVPARRGAVRPSAADGASRP